MVRSIVSFVLVVAVLYVLSLSGSGCAQVGMPIGGPKDTLPPVLLNANPPNQTTGFSANRIVFTFNEYVQLQNAMQNVIVSPLPDKMPGVDYKLKTVTIRLRDTLEENTTYKIELGNSIQDINENNPYLNFTYLFSTGSYIDSLSLGGKVVVAETGGVDTTLMVMLYTNFSDSAVFNEKPRFITRVDRDGNFMFTNLPKDTFHIFALKDDAGQRRYLSTTQLFAFLDSTVVSGQSPEPVTLYAFAEPDEEAATPAQTKATDTLKLISAIENATQDLLSPLALQFSAPLATFDSTRISLSDTLFNPVAFTVDYADSLQTVLNLRVNWKENEKYLLTLQPGLATDTSGNRWSFRDTLAFTTQREASYGSIKISFQNLDSIQNPVLQFVKSGKLYKSFPLSGSVFEQKLFEPGEYTLRLLADENGNGIWDAGHYNPAAPETQRQPERVLPIQQPMNIRAGWENERDILL